MSSDLLLRRFATAVGITALTLLASCQVRPLYSEASGIGQRLNNVGFADPKNRVEQVVRNNLVFLTSGGAGETAHPEYEVKLSAKSTASSILDLTNDQNDDTVSVRNVPVAGRVQIDVTYSLTRVKDGQVLKSATRQVVSLIDVPGQSFAKLRAIRDAENRAAREAAEFVRGDVAIALSKEPQSQTAWQK
ncbi:LPS assembly lipoprotein LptE [Neorhizobium alkalisoli]|uniref:LPS-assembly lipoprotein n=1 Tax=Neorhizobium alkalisoli TaxID=528178 RepID=A0A561Q8C1_9HYPH|nr:LPS assembly lipoprotein LptE [Neorhizobium alkalisoli]TWF46611.1 LPS-assembly lipoprotein [Neorhizobium alkalisoli]